MPESADIGRTLPALFTKACSACPTFSLEHQLFNRSVILRGREVLFNRKSIFRYLAHIAHNERSFQRKAVGLTQC